MTNTDTQPFKLLAVFKHDTTDGIKMLHATFDASQVVHSYNHVELINTSHFTALGVTDTVLHMFD